MFEQKLKLFSMFIFVYFFTQTDPTRTATYHARVHFSCVIYIAAAFQLLPLFIFSMFIFVDFFTQTDPTRTVQRSAICRSRRELSNEYLLAKIGVDTAENEPLEV